VRDLGFGLERGEVLGIVGESGSGKSMTALALMGLLPEGARTTGSVRFETSELLTLPDAEMCRLRGHRLAMVFQEPMTALNPLHPIGRQIVEPLRLHFGLDATDARAEALRLLERVGLPDPARRLNAYPHQLSGGQRQRAMIAMALAGGPDLLLADEPTTALDVTLQAQILDLMRELKAGSGAAIILITHDLGVVAEVCDEVAVMYAGEIVERAPADVLFETPEHPYTVGLLASIPRLDVRTDRLAAIDGVLPDMTAPPIGCRFADRCPFVLEECRAAPPPVVDLGGRWSRCLRTPLEKLVAA